MAIGVFAESDKGVYKKSALEALSYARDLAKKLGQSCIAITVGEIGKEDLGKFGADEHLAIQNDLLKEFNPQAYAMAIAETALNKNIDTLIISQTYNGKSLAPLLAIKMKAALITGVVDMADTSSGFTVKKTCFSNKAFAHVEVDCPMRVLTLIPNSYKISSSENSAKTETVNSNISATDVNTKIEGSTHQSGKIVLTEAELVVSGGRGMKGPENWGIIEELASVLGAATACSKPVADMDWRPHNEHVGQTGISIKPNLYIAIGISGAIQHLAGVGSSKVICVINTDPEAPFFKAADYGIVGDAFEVIPKLIKRAKEIKGLA